MGDPAFHLPDDRRVLLFRLLGGAEPEPLAPDDAGAQLLDRLLLPRLRKVYRDAAKPWPEDTEDLVHDVRVASRRLVEALALVRPVVGKKRARRAMRKAKQLRKALGASREADVLVADFRRLTEAAGMGEEVVHALDAMSAHGQDSLQKMKADHPPEALLSEAVDVLRFAATPRASTPLYALASRHLYARAEAAAPLVRTLEHEARWPEHHQLRIKAKHLRYTVEILSAPFSDSIDGRAVVGRLKEIQDALGVLNDAQDLLDWLRRPALEKDLGKRVLERVRAQADQERRARYARARDLVLGEVPTLLGDVRRSAGLIGPIDA